MLRPNITDMYSFPYKGVTITIQRRTYNFEIDYGYKTSSDITGIAQKSVRQAETDAMHAIDKALKDQECNSP